MKIKEIIITEEGEKEVQDMKKEEIKEISKRLNDRAAEEAGYKWEKNCPSCNKDDPMGV